MTSSPVALAIVILVAAGIVVGLFLLFRRNADRIAPVLQKMGAEFPQPGDDSASVATRDDLGDLRPFTPPTTTPEPIVMPPATSVGASVAVMGPRRLTALDGRTFALPETGALTLGREWDNGVAFPDEASVSRHHARIERDGDSVTLHDLDSTNGTFVDGARVTGSVSLRSGQTVRLGAVELRVD